MKEIIRDMWHGRIVPVEECGNKDPDIEDLVKLIEKNRAVLCTLMDEQQKDRFEKYADCIEEYVSLITERAFCEGVQFTAKFLVEALG